MNVDDAIYATCLLASVGAGHFISKIENDAQRKAVCTIFGTLVVVAVSGFQSLYCFLLGLIGYLPLRLKTRWCHISTFAVMFGGLAVFRLMAYFDYIVLSGHTNMIQMILVLKVVGLALEKSTAHQDYSHISDISDNTSYYKALKEISVFELLNYSFSYIGVLTGPYYRYRTYHDYFTTPFYKCAQKTRPTLDKLKCAAMYCGLYLVSAHIWPLEYTQTQEFYSERSVLYRILYMWPIFFVFRMRIYTGLTLSECVCTMAGFGAYPEAAEPANGEGPRKPYNGLIRNADKQSYNFITITNTRVMQVERCCTFRETMKHWNICVQYWLAVNVYKQFPSKKFRTAATLLSSAFWHGFRPGHYLCLMGAPFYVPIEDMWNNLVRKNATPKLRAIVDVIFWLSKWFTFSYLGTAFVLTSFDKIWLYYSSIYYIGYFTWAIYFAVGIVLKQT